MIYADDVDDAPFFTNNDLPRQITKTAASAAWTATATGTNTVNITAVMQEIISRPGWTSGNDIRFAILENVGTGVNNYVAWADYDKGVGNPTRLDVNYTIPGVRIPRHPAAYNTLAIY